MKSQVKRIGRYIVCVGFIFGSSSTLSAQTVDGIWHSAFSVMGQSFLMDLSVDMTKTQVYLINPEVAGNSKIPCVDISYLENKLSFQWISGGLSFTGNYYQNGDSLTGNMVQKGLSWPVSFKREVQFKKIVNHPQKPLAPYPYETKEVSYQNPIDGTQIFGTFTYPIDQKGNYPIVVFASGSGPQDRDCSILGHQPFLYLADQFARRGIASLRFDDRGAGESKANYAMASLEDFGSDVAAGVRFLSKQKEFKKHKIGLLGHSEGGMHILLAQQEMMKNVNFMIFLCSIGGKGVDVLVQQQYDIPKRNGASDSLSKWNQQLYDGMAQIVMEDPDMASSVKKLDVFLEKMYISAPVGAIAGQSKSEFIANNALFLNNPWGRQFLSFNSADYLKDLKKPSLVIFGGEDDQVAYEPNLLAFKAGFPKEMEGKVDYHVLAGLNHLLQNCKTCTVEEYGQLEETMSPIVPDFIIPFIYKQCE